MKPRVLVVTECSGLNSGYAIYGRHLIKGLFNAGIDVAELATGVNSQHECLQSIPWKVYPNIPNEGTEDKKKYDSFPMAEFGSWQFEAILLDYKPTHIAVWNDVWHSEFILRSPLRKYFSIVAMIPTDAEPQNKMWLDLYQKFDAVLSYTSWGEQLIKKANPFINTCGVAMPFAAPEYVPLPNREELKLQLGFGDIKILGMVARNQRRKLFPDLFRSFSEFLKKTSRNDVYLLCHTSFPERSWEIDEEILKYDIQNRVLFSYICRVCKNVEINLFKGALEYCPRCNNRSSVLASVECGLNHQQMAIIYNLMDAMVLWSSNEGYGMPIAESAACGTPTITIDYAGAGDVSKLTGGKVISAKSFSQEMESGRMMAVPNNEELTKYLLYWFSLPEQMRMVERRKARKNYEKNWNPEQVVNLWINAINNTKPQRGWHEPKIEYKPILPPENLNNQNFVRFIIANVLCEPESLSTWLETRLLRDLDMQIAPGCFGGDYRHEISATQTGTKYQVFSRELILNNFLNIVQAKNFWENARVNS